MENPGRVILIDKPAGISSFGVVARVRKSLTQAAGHKVKVGHTGTLDPFATGLLVLLAGPATKRSNEFLKQDKVYEATLHLGATSTTGDPEGVITPYTEETISASRGRSSRSSLRGSSLGPRRNCGSPLKTEIVSTLQSFLGVIEQTPPQFSAIKVNGQRAYKLARKGIPVEIPSRQVEIYSLELLEYNYPELTIRCHVSSGTYIRTLAEDVGKKLGTGAYLTALRRTKIGDYSVADALTLEDFPITSPES